MKNTILSKKMIFAFIFFITPAFRADSLDPLETKVMEGLRTAEYDNKEGCGIMGAAGRQLNEALINLDNRSRASQLCCNNTIFKENYPFAHGSLCSIGTQTPVAEKDAESKGMDALEKAVALALKAATLSPENGCKAMGATAGRYLKTALISPENRAVAAGLCCENETFKAKHPKAYRSLCEGTSSSKATEFLIDKIDISPERACPSLGKLGRNLSGLTDSQKEKICTTCADKYFKEHPLAKKAVCADSPTSKNEEDAFGEW